MNAERRAQSAGLWVVMAAGLFLSACHPKAGATPTQPVTSLPRGPVIEFELEGVDGSQILSDAFRGRNTVIGFIATYDLASQAEAGFLKAIAHDHVPRTNVLAIVLEPPESKPLVESFVAALSMRFPIAMLYPKDKDASAFRDIEGVPSVLVLDAEGRRVWRKHGLAQRKEIEAVLRSLE